MPLTSWLRSWSGDHPPEKNESVMVAESLMAELDYQLRELDQQRQEAEQESRRQASGGVDYSWLASTTTKPYEMPQLERLELEELCLKVKPEECGRVMTAFRDSLLRQPESRELGPLLRAVILTVLEGRPREETIPEWLTKSLTSLTKIRPISSRKITPLNVPDDEDLEMQHSIASISFSGSSATATGNSGSLSYSTPSDGSIGAFQCVDNLPV